MQYIQETQKLSGYITEADLSEAEQVFIGITHFFDSCLIKPHTFLELVWQFERNQVSL